MSAARRAGAGALAAAALLAGVPAGAGAEAISAGELRALAGRAEGDASARARLGRVDRVDGRAVDVGALVAGARPDEIAPRVELALASASAGAEAADGVAGGGARAQARRVLADRRYTGTRLPRPFTAVLRWLGERAQPLADLLDRLGRAVPGGRATVYGVLAVLVSLLAAAMARRLIRRTSGGSGGRARRGASAAPEDPRALEREADHAEAEGDWDAAVRLRFRAGLLRLGDSEVIAYRPSLTTGEVGRTLASPAFDRVGREFDAIAYGGRDARPEDAAAARDGWRSVLREAGTP